MTEDYEGFQKPRRRNVRRQPDNELEDASFRAFHNNSAFNRGDGDDDLTRMVRKAMKARGLL